MLFLPFRRFLRRPGPYACYKHVVYSTILFVHSWLRWVVIVCGLIATYMAVTDTSEPGRGSRTDISGMAFMTALDIQMLLGLLLYLVVSPNMAEIRANFGAAMQIPQLRFWAVEHITAMLVSVVLVHVGRVLERKATSAASKRTRLSICFGVAMILILAATPWPGMRAGRPLFRF